MLIRSYVFAIAIVSSGACAEEATISGQLAEAATPTLPTLQLYTLIENGRPSDFYKLVLDQRPDVCAPLTQALSKPHLVASGRGKDPGRDLLLGNEYSIEWDELKSDRGLPVSRAEIDLNNDDSTETIYRVAGVRGGHISIRYFSRKTIQPRKR